MALPYPRERRILRRSEFLRFFSGAEAFRLGACVVFRISNDLNGPRLGVTIKTRCNSVERNRIKRQVRESFRLHSPKLGSRDFNVVIPGNQSPAHPYPKKLRAALEKFWGTRA